MGDFNLCLLKSEICKYSQNFLLTLQSCYLIPTIDKPTRVRRNSASLIDNIFTNAPEQVLASGNIISDTSDHYSQFCIFNIDRYHVQLKQNKIRDFSRFSHNKFLDDLNRYDWNSIINQIDPNIDNVFSKFYNKINKIINKHAPMKIASRRQAKRLTKPWITRRIRRSIKRKNMFLATGDITIINIIEIIFAT